MGSGGNKVAVAGIASILLVACVVAAAVSISKRGGDNGGASVSNDQITTSSKSVQAICQPTDYKEACEESLASAKNTSDPKELIKVAFEATMNDITEAIKNSSLLKEAANDPRTKDALNTCDALLDVAIDDLKRSFEKVGDFDASKIKDYTDDLKTWLSAAVTYQETCLDAFENTTGDTGEKMKALLKKAGELTSNGLAMVSSFGDVLTNMEIPGIKRRLLNANESSDYTPFVDAGGRMLLQAVNAKPNVVVAQDGSGQFRTINDALKAVPPKNTETYIIFIKAGIYKEYVIIPRNMNNLVFIGEGPTKTRITGSKNYADGVGTYQTATVAVQGDGFIAKDIGFENAAGPHKHQAVALRVSADMTVFYNCHMDGYQDTLYTHAYRQFYRDCTISGTIDFIFGDGSAVFQNCKMLVRKPMDNQACMVTAQGRKDKRGVGGIVMQGCQVVAEPALLAANPPIQAYLGRPWKEFSRTIIMQSSIDAFIAPEGWSPWAGTYALDTLWYAEYQNRGPGANTAQRVNWRGYQKQITPQVAASFTPGAYIMADAWVMLSGIPYEPGMMKM